MDLPDVDRHVMYLGLTVLVLLPVVGAHNLTVTEPRYASLGMCDVSLECQGIDAGVCLGIEKRALSCVDFQDAPDHRRVEAECALDAQGLCNADPSLSGTGWTSHPNATYNGTACSDWAAQDDRIDLMRCEDTFNSINHWSGGDR